MDIVQHIGSEILKVLNSVPSEVWTIAIESIIGAVSVSPVVLAIKKWFSVDGEKKMVLITSAFSILAAAVAYIATDPAFAPWIIPLQGLVVLGISQPVYYIFVKPLSQKLGAYIMSQIAEATKKVEAKAALVPEGGLPQPSPSYSSFGK